MKCCIKCGESRPEMLARDKAYPDGLRALCKPCKCAHKNALRKAKKEAAYVPPPPPPEPGLVARSRDYVPQGSYVPDQLAYYRNNGNKHIQSRG